MLRADKDRILIRSSVAGLFSLILASAISIFVPSVFPCARDGFCLYTSWQNHVPWEYSGTAMLAFLFGALGWVPLNLFCSREAAINRAIQQDADPLELALKQSQDEQLPMAFTLKNEKVYIGIVTHQFNPATPTDSIAILPLHSGYRDPKSKQLFLPVNYAKVVKQMRDRLDQLPNEIAELSERIQSAESVGKDVNLTDLEKSFHKLTEEWEFIEKRIDLFSVIIPVDQIASAFFFDSGVYWYYFDSRNQLDHTETTQ